MIGRLGQMAGLGGVGTLKDVGTVADPGPGEIGAQKFAGWVQRVGDQRAEQARALYYQVRAQPNHSFTLPELLTEVWLRQAGISYEAQVQLQSMRPDFVLFNAGMAGAMVWRVQGEYWHTQSAAINKDLTQKAMLSGLVVRGYPVTAIVDLWENDIYASEAVFAQGLRGVQTR